MKKKLIVFLLAAVAVVTLLAWLAPASPEEAFMRFWGVGRYCTETAWNNYLNNNDAQEADGLRQALLTEAEAFASALGPAPITQNSCPINTTSVLARLCGHAQSEKNPGMPCLAQNRIGCGSEHAELFVLSSLGRIIKCHITIPTKPGPHPLLVALHQTTYHNIDEPVGLSESANNYACFFAKKGFVTVTPEILGFGRLYADLARGGYPITCDRKVWWQPIYWLREQCANGTWNFDYYKALLLIFPRYLLLFNAKGDVPGRLPDNQLEPLRALYQKAGLQSRLIIAMDEPVPGPKPPHRFDADVQEMVWALLKPWR